MLKEGIGKDISHTHFRNLSSGDYVGWWSPDPLESKYPLQSPYILNDNNPVIKKDSKGDDAIIVHGTWSSSETWDPEIKVEFESMIRKKFDVKGKIHYSDWSGKNSKDAREHAGKRLASFIRNNISENELNPKTRTDNLVLVGHSHGGNVDIIATNQLLHDDITVDFLLTFNTPVREYSLSLKTNTTHYHVYGEYDLIQFYGGGKGPLFQNKFKNIATEFFFGEVGESKSREFENAINIKVPLLPNLKSALHNSHNSTSVYNQILKYVDVKADYNLLNKELTPYKEENSVKQDATVVKEK